MSNITGVVRSIPAISSNLVVSYNEVTSVIAGLEIIVATYTVNTAADCFLQSIESSGDNVSEFRLYLNADIINKKYGSFTVYNVNFDYTTGIETAPGLKLQDGDIIYIKAIHNRPQLASFNAKIQIVEQE